MAEGDVLSGDKVKIYIGPAGSYAGNLGTEYQAEITSFKSSGGSTDYDSTAVFGGFIDVKKPTEQIELSYDLILRFGNPKKWHDLLQDSTKKTITIEATDGTNYYWESYNNCRSVSFDRDFSADDAWKGTITFKLSPTDANGITNIQVGDEGSADDATHGVQDWSSL